MHDKLYEGSEVLDHLEHQLQSLIISYLSSLEKLKLMYSLSEMKTEETGFYDRHARKVTEGSAMQFDTYLHETTILGLSKIIEDTTFLLKQKLGHKLKIWEDNLNLPYTKELRSICCLSNIIKHNKSVLKASKRNRHANYLLEEYDLVDGYELYVYIYGRYEFFDIISLAPKLYLCLSQLIEEISLCEPRMHGCRLSGKKDKEIFNIFYQYMIPDDLEIEKPYIEIGLHANT